MSESMKVALERYRCAIHEAGHAIVLEALGPGALKATIVYDERTRQLGTTLIRDDSILPGQIDKAVRLAAGCHAGALAVKRWNPQRRDWEDGAADDIDRAGEFLRRAMDDRVTVGAFSMRWALLNIKAKSDAERVLADQWPAVCRVADELLLRGTLHQEDIVRLCTSDL